MPDTYSMLVFRLNDFQRISGSEEALTSSNTLVQNENYTYRLTGEPSVVTVLDPGERNDVFDGTDPTQTLIDAGDSGLSTSGSSDFQLYDYYTIALTSSDGATLTGRLYRVDNQADSGNYNAFFFEKATYQFMKAHPNVTFQLTGKSGVRPSSVPSYNDIPCFAAEALIETDRGLVPAGDLVPGDLVRTRDAGFQVVRWVGNRNITAVELAASPKLRPIRIKAGALSDGLPTADLVVSPQHRVLVRSNIAQKMFGTNEILVAAKQLLQIDGIDIAHDLDHVNYVHFLFDDHQIVYSNGAETESLYVGDEALKSVGQAAREEIFAIFPELKDREHTPAPARVLATGRMARKLAIRHVQNGKRLVQ